MGQYCITICHSTQLHEGLMVFSDDFLHFLKIKKKNCRIHKNCLVALGFTQIWLDLAALLHTFFCQLQMQEIYDNILTANHIP